MNRARWTQILAASLLLLATCAQATERVTLFAAASLTDALTEISAQFQQDTGIRVRASYASSSVLARQIRQGAPADIYLSADQRWMDYAAQLGALDQSSRVTLLGNRLVLVAPDSTPLQPFTLDGHWPLEQQLQGGRLAAADPDHVPAGRYARQALEHFGLWPQAASRLTRNSNVRSALALVERGETPLGIVYATDARASSHTRVLAQFPAHSHAPIEYPLAIVAGRRNPATERFYAYLQSAGAAEVFARHGFEVR